MSTLDVPGANPANRDKLSRGAWAEHDDGSLIYVLDIDENDRVIANIYDFSIKDTPTYYPLAMALPEFEKTFSYDPKKVGQLNLKWTWHDKTAMPWERVMREINRPNPMPVNVEDQLSAAARVAKSLNQKAGRLTPAHVDAMSGVERRGAGRVSRTIFQRLKNAMNELVH